jgi:phage terminase Nu1 subunit (DNA packaging protein)
MASNTQPIAVIARLLDLTERRVQQLAREGVIPPAARSGAERGRYDLVGAVRGYVHYLREQAARSQAGTADFGAERARLVKAKADLAEMDAGARRSDLLPAADVEAAWIAVLERLRARLLVLPDRLAPLVHEETTIAGARASIRETIAEALTELSSLPVDRAPDPEGEPPPDPGGAPVADDSDATAGADDRGLG